jgi:hypothetical protein
MVTCTFSIFSELVLNWYLIFAIYFLGVWGWGLGFGALRFNVQWLRCSIGFAVQCSMALPFNCSIGFAVQWLCRLDVQWLRRLIVQLASPFNWLKYSIPINFNQFPITINYFPLTIFH